MSDTICQVATCDRPSDDWIVCRVCAALFEQVLAEMPWMLDELDTVITQQTRYTTESSGKSADTPMMFNVKASDMRGKLVTELDTAARMVADSNGWKLSHTDAAGASRWLMRSLTAIRLHEAGALIVDGIMATNAGCLWVIDRPAAKQYLGDCPQTHGEAALIEKCQGRIYGRQGKDRASCDTCGTEWEAALLREFLLKQLDDRLCTASEIAHLSTYLGLLAGREQVRKRINQWHTRGLIVSHETKPDAMFRFGEVYVMLAQDDTARRSA
jgi:hypothetical protein